MAIPVLALLGKVAGNAIAQRAAAKVAGDVYQRIMAPQSPVSEVATIDALAARLDEMATREELIASFAALQSELDRRHQRASYLLVAVILLQAAAIAIVLVV